MLRALHVSKSFADRLLFEDVTFAVAAGDRVGLVGPNGSGKTTLLGILAGEIPPDSGSIHGHQDGTLVVSSAPAGSPESGGQRTRRRLAAALRSGADLLLLDEPTQNLDARGLAWLETALIRHAGACLVVSHDREFLDRVTTRTLMLDPVARRVREYGGTYSLARRERDEELERLAREHREQAHAARRLAADILAVRQQAREYERISVNDFYRGKAKKVAAQARGRQTRLERLQRELEGTEAPRELEKMRPGFACRDLHGALLIEAIGLAVGRGGAIARSGIALRLHAGERLEIRGPNGCGKTTLLETLLGRLLAAGGEIRRRDDLRIGYLPQGFEVPRGEPTVLGYIRGSLPPGGLEEGAIRTFLHRFLFSRDDVHKRLGALSSGERSRAELARLMLAQPDLLVLDEPTNHLDIDSCERLEAALAAYPGALIVVSHDRRFLSRIRCQSRLDL